MAIRVESYRSGSGFDLVFYFFNRGFFELFFN